MPFMLLHGRATFSHGDSGNYTHIKVSIFRQLIIDYLLLMGRKIRRDFSFRLNLCSPTLPTPLGKCVHP